MAAFRRYADRNGVVFVPMAEPLASGKKARFALTLKDGGVMVEGEAEVVSSSRTPSVLHGRIGMTLKFLVPDEPSKTTLGELEKARLALKPQPPSIAPRPAEVPAEPRPKPPVLTGRIDAVNALAESVAIGEGIPLPGQGGDVPPKNANPKFVVPSLGTLPVGRPKTISKPPPTPATSPTATTMGVAPLKRADAEQTMRGPPPAVDLTKPPKEDLSTTMRGTKPASPTTPRNPPPASTPPPVPSGKPRMATPFAPMPIVQQPAPPIVAAAKPRAPEIEVGEPTDLTPIPQIDDALPRPLADPLDANEITHLGAAPVPATTGATKPQERTVREPRRTVIGVAVVPSGVMVLPAAPAMRVPSDDEVRDTGVMGVPAPSGQITARGGAVEEIDALGETIPPRSLTPSLVQAIVEEPTPSGDWTMTPGANGPTITPTSRGKLGRASTQQPVAAGPPTGDWMIALDPSQPDGWSEPSKVEKRPAGELKPGPPMSVVSSARPLDSNKRLGTEPSILDMESSAPKVQIDPTLIEPLTALPPLDDDEDNDDPATPPPPVSAPIGADGLMSTPTSPIERGGYEAPPMAGALANHKPGSIANVFTPAVGLPLAASTGAQLFAPAPSTSAPPARVVTDADSGFFRDSGDVPSYSNGPATALTDGARSKRLIVIVASAVGVAVLAIILVLAFGGNDKATTAAPATSTTTDKLGPPTVEQDVVTTPADAPTAVTPVPDAVAVVAPSTECKVSVSSVPAGAEIVMGKDVVGKTPVALTLPCGAETKLVIRKARFVAQTKTVTPKAEGGKPLKVSLARVTFSVKVSSTPPGASITVAGKSMGFTPTNVKLPAFESATLKLAKDGFAPETQKITPKQNNQTVHTALKKIAKKRGR